MKLEIREVRESDAQEIIQILNPIIRARNVTVLDREFTEKQEREYIKNFPDRGIFLVAVNTEQKKIVGFQSMEPFATYTHAFDHVAGIGTYVETSLHNKGVGQALATRSFEKAKEYGYEKIFTYVRADNKKSLNYHLKLGFSVIGTSSKQAKVDGKYIDEVIIEKLL